MFDEVGSEQALHVVVGEVGEVCDGFAENDLVFVRACLCDHVVVDVYITALDVLFCEQVEEHIWVAG